MIRNIRTIENKATNDGLFLHDSFVCLPVCVSERERESVCVCVCVCRCSVEVDLFTLVYS